MFFEISGTLCQGSLNLIDVDLLPLSIYFLNVDSAIQGSQETNSQKKKKKGVGEGNGKAFSTCKILRYLFDF